MSRYPAMFAALKERGEGAFVPFVMVGDPDPDTSEAVIEALIAGGADALELGVPFTDPVADGPTIQKAHVRALAAGVGFQDCLEVVQRVRRRHPFQRPARRARARRLRPSPRGRKACGVRGPA